MVFLCMVIGGVFIGSGAILSELWEEGLIDRLFGIIVGSNCGFVCKKVLQTSKYHNCETLSSFCAHDTRLFASDTELCVSSRVCGRAVTSYVVSVCCGMIHDHAGLLQHPAWRGRIGSSKS